VLFQSFVFQSFSPAIPPAAFKETILGIPFSFDGVEPPVLTMIPTEPYAFGNGGVKMALVFTPPWGSDLDNFEIQILDGCEHVEVSWSDPEVVLRDDFLTLCQYPKAATDAYQKVLAQMAKTEYTGKDKTTFQLSAKVIYQKKVAHHCRNWAEGKTIVAELLLALEDTAVCMELVFKVPAKKAKYAPVAKSNPTSSNGNGGTGGTSTNSGNKNAGP
jgi:hypothetical protein